MCPQLRDLGDTAALISQLDLVVTVDTAVAHVAGALGKPVWVLLSEPADWRWLTGSEDSPWYPTARLFRQKRHGDWDEVIGRVKEALREWVARGGKAPELPKREERVLEAARGTCAAADCGPVGGDGRAGGDRASIFRMTSRWVRRWSGTGSGCRGNSS